MPARTTRPGPTMQSPPFYAFAPARCWRSATYALRLFCLKGRQVIVRLRRTTPQRKNRRDRSRLKGWHRGIPTGCNAKWGAFPEALPEALSFQPFRLKNMNFHLTAIRKGVGANHRTVVTMQCRFRSRQSLRHGKAVRSNRQPHFFGLPVGGGRNIRNWMGDTYHASSVAF